MERTSTSTRKYRELSRKFWSPKEKPYVKGTPLLKIDDSVQRATVEQQKSQAEAALALLEELKAQPRKENLEVATAQVELASANLKSAQDQLDKQRKSYELDPNSVSKDTLDNAENAVKVAKANLEVAQKQYELIKAGAWVYDIRNQEKQYNALSKAFMASNALLAKYIIKAPSDGVILSINAAVGSYISSQGAYETYTQGSNPVVVMGNSEPTLESDAISMRYSSTDCPAVADESRDVHPRHGDHVSL